MCWTWSWRDVVGGPTALIVAQAKGTGCCCCHWDWHSVHRLSWPSRLRWLFEVSSALVHCLWRWTTFAGELCSCFACCSTNGQSYDQVLVRAKCSVRCLHEGSVTQQRFSAASPASYGFREVDAFNFRVIYSLRVAV